MLKKETRHKVITILISFADNKPRLLTMRDRRHKEWLFVTGGCRRKEIDTPIVAALRELEEETRGVINLKTGVYSYFSFECNNRTQKEIIKDLKNGLDVKIIYHVYIFELNIPRSVQQNYIDEFYKVMKNNTHCVRRCYDENDMIAFDTLDEFCKRNMWPFINDNVIKNPKFLNSISSSNRQYFNIKH